MSSAVTVVKGLLVGAVMLGLVSAWSGAVLASPKSLRIAMILWRGETEAEKGFQDGLKELGYSAQPTVFNAGQDRAELGRLLRDDLRPRLESLDYVYVFGTTATLAAQSIVQDKVPLIFNIVADPVGAGIVRSMDASGSNVAGVTNEIPVSLQIHTVFQIMPFKRLGLLFNPREKNSMLIREKVLEVARSLGVEVEDLRSPPAQDMLQGNLQRLRDKSAAVDAVYLPADSFIVSNAKLIGSELRAARVKSIGAIETYIDHGALIGVVPDYYQLGKAAATIVHRHQGGQRLHEMSVQTPKEPVLKINATTSRALKFDIPASVRKRAIVVE